jgi:hypothetical protein
MKDVYAIYGSKTDGRDRRWLRVEVAFPDRDGSVNAILDALPLSDPLQICDRAQPQTGKEEPR